MGVTLCKKHGQQFFYHTCEHIYEDFQKGVHPKMFDFPVLSMKVCSNCFTKLDLKEYKDYTINNIFNLSKVDLDKIESELEQKYDQIKNSACICKECMKELHLNHFRKIGKKDPFESFEKTLIHQDKETIDALNVFLLKNYKFEDMQCNGLENMKACQLKSGGISYPLVITIYYVTDRKEQNKVLDLIDQFFKDIEKKQRIVRFYEKENWTENKFGVQSRDEIMLLEVKIK